MTLFDLLYVLRKDTTVCIGNHTRTQHVWGQKRKVKNITISDLARMGNHEVMAVYPGDDKCLYINLWDSMDTKIQLACHNAIRVAKKNGTLR